MRIAVDVMGGDHAPSAILTGCLDAVGLLAPEDRIVLVGDEAIIRKGLADRQLEGDPHFEIEATTRSASSALLLVSTYFTAKSKLAME